MNYEKEISNLELKVSDLTNQFENVLLIIYEMSKIIRESQGQILDLQNQINEVRHGGD